jgi:hypothetical protein
MTATLDEIHLDPRILDKAIARRESLDIIDEGRVAATLVPVSKVSVDDARRIMTERFAAPDWDFSLAQTMSRDERNARA